MVKSGYRLRYVNTVLFDLLLGGNIVKLVQRPTSVLNLRRFYRELLIGYAYCSFLLYADLFSNDQLTRGVPEDMYGIVYIGIKVLECVSKSINPSKS